MMMDLKEGKRLESDSTNCKNSSSQVKSCSDCHTTKTPLWRGGPAGPKSLCNACGIKYNKKRRQFLGLDKGKKKRKDSKSRREVEQLLKTRLAALGGKALLRRSGELMGELREEEQAAILLMALSCSSVYS